MPGSSNTSFIPKKNGIQNDRGTAVRKVYVGTLIVRILFVSSLLAVVGVNAYQYKLKGDLDAQVVALNAAIDGFNDSEMQRVVSIDKRLTQVSDILDHTLSVSSLLKALEDSTAESVQITQLKVTRDASNNIVIVSELDTNSFDSALFQKNILEKSDTLSVLEVTDLQIKNVNPKSAEGDTELSEEKKITFKAKLAVAIEKVPHTVGGPISATPVVSPVDAQDALSENAASDELVESNQEEI